MSDYTKYRCLDCEYHWTDHDQYLTKENQSGERCPECGSKNVKQVTVSAERE